jgi:hypothetical protein
LDIEEGVASDAEDRYADVWFWPEAAEDNMRSNVGCWGMT